MKRGKTKDGNLQLTSKPRTYDDPVKDIFQVQHTAHVLSMPDFSLIREEERLLINETCNIVSVFSGDLTKRTNTYVPVTFVLETKRITTCT